MSDPAELANSTSPQRAPFHPVVWLILYVPFGALGGFITVALTFLATRHGLSISEGALLGGAQLLSQWLKWLWAPVVDITLSPKRWYVISTALSSLGVLAMSAVPLDKNSLGLLLAVIAIASLVNSVVGMAVEAMIARTPASQVGRVSAWFQAGNLGGAGLGGGLGLLLIQKLPSPWMSGAIMGTIFMLCCLALIPIPAISNVHTAETPTTAIKGVAVGLWQMLKTKIGFLSALLCLLPVGTGAAMGTLTQADVASHWGAGSSDVELVQGLFAGLITAIGCFAGGWVCSRINSRVAYAIFGLTLAAVAIGMALCPPMPGLTVNVALDAIGFNMNVHVIYAAFNLLYAFGVGLAYAAFTAVALSALGDAAAATGYNVFASLSNFPIWWLGILLGWMADPTKGAHHGPSTMLLTEAVLGVIGVAVFFGATRSKLSFLGQPRAEAEIAPAL